MSESLKAKTVKGVGWSFADNLANSGITFLVGLVLAPSMGCWQPS